MNSQHATGKALYKLLNDAEKMLVITYLVEAPIEDISPNFARKILGHLALA